MQIVIDISLDDYETLKQMSDVGLGHYHEIILSGTPLPKGHGRLIDADAVLEEPIGNTYKDIDIAETIIDADKESENGEVQ